MIPTQNEEWFKLKEVGGSTWHFRFMLWATCHLPLFCVKFLVAIICFFFWLGAKPIRKRSKIYLNHLAKCTNKNDYFLGTYKHIFSFALSMIEKLLGWRGAIKLNQIETKNDDLKLLVEGLNKGQGAFLICSHLGNMEMLRSLTEYGGYHTQREFKVYPVVDFSGTAKFNKLLFELNADLMKMVVDANKIGVDSAIWMKEKIAEGNLVAVAGDRVSANTERYVELEFLGEKAKFPEGAFTLASLMNAPIYFAFAIRKNDFDIKSDYEVHVIKAKTDFKGRRKERGEKLKNMAKEFAILLENFSKKHPYQWYNFYNFWS